MQSADFLPLSSQPPPPASRYVTTRHGVRHRNPEIKHGGGFLSDMCTSSVALHGVGLQSSRLRSRRARFLQLVETTKTTGLTSWVSFVGELCRYLLRYIRISGKFLAKYRGVLFHLVPHAHLLAQIIVFSNNNNTVIFLII